MRSLRWQLLVVTSAALMVALLLAALLLAGLFRQHASAQFEQQLHYYLDELTARFDPGAAAGPSVRDDLSDPRWRTPYSGLYWQVERIGANGSSDPTVLRSRSLWDAALHLPVADAADARLQRHLMDGPTGQPLVAFSRNVRLEPSAGPASGTWRLTVASETTALEAATQGFARQLSLYLLILGLALLGVAWAQASLGLRPLHQLKTALQALRSGHAQRLEGRFPAEVTPLVSDFNRVLELNQQSAERARRSAGDLAHAIKTPLAVLEQLLHDPVHRVPAELQAPMLAQLSGISRQLDWQLHRARQASLALPGQRTVVLPVLQDLLRVLQKLHAVRRSAGQELEWQLDCTAPDATFAGTPDDLQQAIGNLLDNAGKWAAKTVRTRLLCRDHEICLIIEDDGPGLSSAQQEQALERGVRLDERQPGNGLGLDIVRDLMQIHGGRIELQRSELGGLAASLIWSATACVRP